MTTTVIKRRWRPTIFAKTCVCACVCVEVPGPVRGVFHQYYVVVRMLRGVLPWLPTFP